MRLRKTRKPKEHQSSPHYPVLLPCARNKSSTAIRQCPLFLGCVPTPRTQHVAASSMVPTVTLSCLRSQTTEVARRPTSMPPLQTMVGGCMFSVLRMCQSATMGHTSNNC